MKRFLILLCMVALYLSLMATANADVLWEPIDPYWWTNHDACIYLGHTYIMNGPDGYTPVYTTPSDTNPAFYLPNGGEFYIAAYTEMGSKKMCVIQYKTTESGEIVHNWGDNVDATYSAKEGSGTGWVDMSMVVQKYDNSSFENDFGSEFTKGEFIFEHDLKEGTKVILWEYPGAESVKHTLTLDGKVDSTPITFSSLYTDENGLEWGEINYYFGMRDSWICISDPTSESLPIREINYDLIPTSDTLPAFSNSSIFNLESPYLAIVLVAAVVIITAVLIAFLFKKNHSTEKTS